MKPHSKRVNRLLKEEIGKNIVSIFGYLIIILTFCLVFFIASKGLTVFLKDNFSIIDFLFTKIWNPDRPIENGGPAIGALIFIVGSVAVSSLALIFSAPLSVATAVFMTEISPKIGEKILQPVIEIFVGIPSVVYGWVGLSVFVPFIRNHFSGHGFSLLAGGAVLAIMIMPTITSVSSDAFKRLPKDYKEASLALGATRWQTISKVLLPAAFPGILTGIVLGLARAFGEALAVQMVIGNSINLPGSILDSTTTLTSIITMDMGNTPSGSIWNSALWSMALLLLVISFLFIVLIRKIGAKGGLEDEN